MFRLINRLRRGTVKVFGYRPKLFWDLWALNYDKDPEKHGLHEWNREALRIINEIRPGSILELGCGFGRNLKILMEEYQPGNLAGVDISNKMLKKARHFLGTSEIGLYRSDVRELPFGDNSFELVFVSAVLMHIPQAGLGKQLGRL